MNRRPAWVTVAASAIAYAVMIMPWRMAPADASTACILPRPFSLEVAERRLLDMQGTGLVVTGASAPSPLRPGDVVRQANGRQTTTCRDLETATAEALAKGLLLLLAVERDRTVLAVALSDREVPVVAAPVPIVPPGPAAAAPPAAADARPPAARAEAPAPVPSAVPAPTAAPVRATALPDRAEASAELAAKAVAAAAVLATLDEAARLTVPLATYDRRLGEAGNAITALNLAGEGSAPVRAVIAETLGYHETARDIRRYKAAELEHARVDERGAGGLSLSYFSDSEVPRWIERYPFLSESLQQAPRSTRLLLPGETAGRWNPDRAVELLWEQARTTRKRIADWGADAR